MTLFDSTQLALEAAMRGSALRQSLLTSNLANVNTPDYQRKDVDFHAALRAAQRTDQPLETLSFQPTSSGASPTGQRVVRPDGSGVDADQEAAALAENGLEYQALVQVAGARNAILQTAMGVR
ncbi:MAG: flagellar basal body rod protein FlgB [Conexibacter sp.]